VTLFAPGEPAPVAWLYLDRDTPDRRLAERLDLALPGCAWSCHVVATGGDRDGLLLGSVVRHLEREPVAVVHFHQVVDGGLAGAPQLERLLGTAERFQTEAYRERTGARLVPLPILEVAAGGDPRPTLAAAAAAAARLARPSLLLWDEPDQPTVAAAAAHGLRLYLGSPATAGGVVEILTDAHVFDSVLDRLEGPLPLLAPCRPHELVAEGRIFGCARQWRRGLSRAGVEDRSEPGWRPDERLCAGCIADTVAGSARSVVANRRPNEGRELALRTSAALVDAGSPAAAAAVARTAVELSVAGPPRADALVQEALCRLAATQLPAADQALLEAAAQGADPGLVAYHRARVQVAWRDDIEALDRFAEALELGAAVVAPDDLRLEMALSHIRLEEWAEARRHLAGIDGPSAAVAFNLGVCEVNDGHPERALGHLDRALELGPPADDLGRVRFFRGFCLSRLERWAEALADLGLAVGLETPELAHHNLIGVCLFKLGRHREAAASFEAALALDPGSAVDWANLGLNLERLGETGRATASYRRALAIDRSIGFARDGLERLAARPSGPPP
jgi:tetratricopeptide (TPR) repeat protein